MVQLAAIDERQEDKERNIIKKTLKQLRKNEEEANEARTLLDDMQRNVDEAVKTTPQMTRFRDAKVCNNLATDEIDDHRIQSDYNKNCNIQKERTLHLILRMRGEDSRHQ